MMACGPGLSRVLRWCWEWQESLKSKRVGIPGVELWDGSQGSIQGKAFEDYPWLGMGCRQLQGLDTLDLSDNKDKTERSESDEGP